VWGNDDATVTAQPIATGGPRLTPDQTAAEVRTFLAELHIKAVKQTAPFTADRGTAHLAPVLP